MKKYFLLTKDSSYYVQAVILDPWFSKHYLLQKSFHIKFLGVIETAIQHIKNAVMLCSVRSGVLATEGDAAMVLVVDNDEGSFFFNEPVQAVVPVDEVDKYLALAKVDFAV